MNNKRCGTCRHWRRDGDSQLGKCAFTLPDTLPVWVSHRRGSSILETYGSSCNAWDSSDDLHALCGEILQTLRANYLRGAFTCVDNATFEALMDGWSKRLREIKA